MAVGDILDAEVEIWSQTLLLVPTFERMLPPEVAARL